MLSVPLVIRTLGLESLYHGVANIRRKFKSLEEAVVSLGFEIPQKKSLDLLSLGALVHRLDPGIIPFRKATNFAVHVSGGEFNVAANLADCFKLDTGVASAMVDYPIEDLI